MTAAGEISNSAPQQLSTQQYPAQKEYKKTYCQNFNLPKMTSTLAIQSHITEVNRNYDVEPKQNLLALKIKIVNSCGCGTSNATFEKTRTQRRHKMAAEEKESKLYVTFPLVTYVNNIFLALLSINEVHIDNQQSYKFNESYAHKSYFSKVFMGTISEYKVGSHWKVFDYY